MGDESNPAKDYALGCGAEDVDRDPQVSCGHQYVLRPDRSDGSGLPRCMKRTCRDLRVPGFGSSVTMHETEWTENPCTPSVRSRYVTDAVMRGVPLSGESGGGTDAASTDSSATFHQLLDECGGMIDTATEEEEEANTWHNHAGQISRESAAANLSYPFVSGMQPVTCPAGHLGGGWLQCAYDYYADETELFDPVLGQRKQDPQWSFLLSSEHPMYRSLFPDDGQSNWRENLSLSAQPYAEAQWVLQNLYREGRPEGEPFSLRTQVAGASAGYRFGTLGRDAGRFPATAVCIPSPCQSLTITDAVEVRATARDTLLTGSLAEEDVWLDHENLYEHWTNIPAGEPVTIHDTAELNDVRIRCAHGLVVARCRVGTGGSVSTWEAGFLHNEETVFNAVNSNAVNCDSFLPVRDGGPMECPLWASFSAIL